ncbi:Adenosine deaminase CECR1 [Madurella mycetomatis]|uniref:adenosine deaminase n=1 Tax=Madurella mycetomatis TaxID=100816 RepID=A0A175W2P1_9PEZI|nr:Adenosine deaminase CECR1 [Madurella mycetomatis]
MGNLNSCGSLNSDRDGDEQPKEPKQAPTNTVKTSRRHRLTELMTNYFPFRSSEKDKRPGDPSVGGDAVRQGEGTMAKRLKKDGVAVVDSIYNSRNDVGQPTPQIVDDSLTALLDFSNAPTRPERSKFADNEAYEQAREASEAFSRQRAEAYDTLRKEVTRREEAMGFEFACTKSASELEIRANRVLQRLKEQDIERFYKTAKPKIGFHGQKHARFYGDHFLSNADIIEETQLFALCRAMPKGAHLHIHFNANLLPNFLLSIAKKMDHMFIWSNMSLAGDTALDQCKIQFSIMSRETAESRGKGNLLDRGYEGQRVMRFKDFIAEWKRHNHDVDVDVWLQNKLVFQEEEAHNMFQTAEGAWEKFNARTQMMKGLFNYETAYKEYTTQCLKEFRDDNIQYAEIRPNFMSTNQVWKDDGSDQIDNKGIMEIIIKQYKAFQREHQWKVVKGLKVIYCTPRSFSNDLVEAALKECLEFKKSLDYSDYIAGFDLVGEEGKGRPLKDFKKEFLEFKRLCAQEKMDIPFLFHCGETLDIGTETDGNLVDALLLGSKRIGHGFALPRHPYIMEQMRQRNVCVEVCPISNEILGLTPRISGHSMYSLLANNVPCTINADNGTLFRSTLSHDFYQVMAGKSDMTLHGLRQLIEWSIEHSCMEPDLKVEVQKDWEEKWKVFCQQIVDGRFAKPPSKL